LLNGNKVSVITPAWRCENYVQKMLKSIENQTERPYEVLVGVDNCESTLQACQKYPASKKKLNLRLFWFSKHVGPYLIRNTLVTQSKGDVVIMSDADDEMCNDYLKAMCEIALKGNHARARRQVIKNGRPQIDPTPEFGVLCGIRKDLFMWMGGYDPWPIQADTAFMKRCMRMNIKRELTKNIVYLYHKHEDSLTESTKTGYKSSLRQHYKKLIRRQEQENPRRPYVTVSECEELI